MFWPGRYKQTNLATNTLSQDRERTSKLLCGIDSYCIQQSIRQQEGRKGEMFEPKSPRDVRTMQTHFKAGLPQLRLISIHFSN